MNPTCTSLPGSLPVLQCLRWTIYKHSLPTDSTETPPASCKWVSFLDAVLHPAQPNPSLSFSEGERRIGVGLGHVLPAMCSQPPVKEDSCCCGKYKASEDEISMLRSDLDEVCCSTVFFPASNDSTAIPLGGIPRHLQVQGASGQGRKTMFFHQFCSMLCCRL